MNLEFAGRRERAGGHLRAVVHEVAGGGGQDHHAVPRDAAVREVGQGARGQELPHPRVRRGLQVSECLSLKYENKMILIYEMNICLRGAEKLFSTTLLIIIIMSVLDKPDIYCVPLGLTS